jgi:hypothetical protein
MIGPYEYMIKMGQEKQGSDPDFYLCGEEVFGG